MSFTIIERAVKRHVDELMIDPKWCHILADYLSKLKRGIYPSWFVDVVFQNDDRREISLYDAYCYSQIHTMLYSGELAMCAVHIGDYPSSDRLGDEINSKLKRLWKPFSARFWGGNVDADGVFTISDEIDFECQDGLTGNRWRVRAGGDFPLEVGTTSADKTFAYLTAPGRMHCLARWPYHSRDIFVLRVPNQPAYYDIRDSATSRKELSTQLAFPVSF